jgi:hypothetical protein
MWKVLNRAFRAAGVTGMAGIHCMRKTFASNVHKALGGDLFRTGKAMRHSSPLSTLRYLSFKQDEIDRAFFQHTNNRLQPAGTQMQPCPPKVAFLMMACSLDKGLFPISS